MILLAVGSVFSGGLFAWGGTLQHWLEPVVGAHEEARHALPAWVSTALALAVVAVGIAVAYRKYGRREIPEGGPRSGVGADDGRTQRPLRRCLQRGGVHAPWRATDRRAGRIRRRGSWTARSTRWPHWSAGPRIGCGDCKPASPATTHYRCWRARRCWSRRSWRCNCGELERSVADGAVAGAAGGLGADHPDAARAAAARQVDRPGRQRPDAGGVDRHRGRLQDRRRRLPIRRKPALDTGVRRRLHPRRGRHRGGAGAADRGADSAAAGGRLERRRRANPRRAGLRRPDAGHRVDGADLGDRAGRVAVLRVLRGHARSRCTSSSAVSARRPAAPAPR